MLGFTTKRRNGNCLNQLTSILIISWSLDLLLPDGQHVIERVVAYALPGTGILDQVRDQSFCWNLLNTLDPVILFLLRAGGHPVHSVFALHHLPLTVSLARLDHLVAITEELETVLLASVRHLPDLMEKELK